LGGAPENITKGFRWRRARRQTRFRPCQVVSPAGRDRGLLISASRAFQAKQKPIRYGLVRDRLFL